MPDSITLIGSSAFSGCSGLTSITLPDSITSIGNNVFAGCSDLTSITLHDSITSIGNNAFYGCSGLTYITLPDSISSIGTSAFQFCSGLTSITLPDSITSIGTNAFNGCTSLSSIIINSYLSNIRTIFFGLNNANMSWTFNYNGAIPNNACNGKSLMTSLTIGNQITSIGNSAFGGCSGLTSITLPNSITSIESSGFYGCSGLTSITLPNSITSIGNNAFYGCSGLTSITLPNTITSIGNSAFSSCSGFTYITLPNTITSIENSAFYGCSGLTSITLPNSITSIGEEAFANCSNLITVVIGNPYIIENVNTNSFTYVSNNLDSSITFNYTESLNELSSTFQTIATYYATQIYVPPPSTTIDGIIYSDSGNETAFVRGYTAIEDISANSIVESSVIISGTTYIVSSIGNSAFNDCSSLNSIILPNTITSIGTSAFQSCSGLSSITLPNSITSIGDEAFANCSNLITVVIENPSNIETVNTNSFTDVNNNQDSSITFNYTESLSDLSSPFQTIATYYANQIYIPPPSTTIDGIIYTDTGNETAFVSGFTEDISAISIVESSVSISGTTCLVTSIENSAFNNCFTLTNITLPNSIKSIGNSAFDGCSNLITVVIENPSIIETVSTNSFTNVSNIQNSSITFNNTVSFNTLSSTFQTISTYYANQNYIPPQTTINGIIYIAFDLSNVNVSGYTQDISANSIVESSVTISGTTYTVSSIGNSAFQDCTSLISITLPSNTITTIGTNAFNGCTSLGTIDLPDSITTIGASAFANCSSLTEINLPNSITSIVSNLCSYCSALTEIILPNSITTIGFASFFNCSSLVSITLPDSITTIGTSAFYGCSELTSITFPSSIISIEENAFNYCPNLITVVFENPFYVNNVQLSSFTDVSNNQDSSITFNNTESFNDLSSTFQTIAYYYANISPSPIIPPTLTDFSFNTQTYGVAPFTIQAPTSDSDGSFSYTSNDDTVAVITDVNVINIVGVGIAMITATQDASGNYSEGSIDASLNVIQSTPIHPAEISNGSALDYFMETTSDYGNITNTPITLSGPLLAQSSKTITTSDATTILMSLPA